MPAEQDEAVSSRRGAWHQSTLSTIGDCPRRWWLTYELGLPDPSGEAATIGTAIHKSVECHEQGRIDGVEVSFDDALSAGLLGLDPALAGPVEQGLRHWWSTPMKGGGPSHREWLGAWTPIAIEPYFNVPLVEGALPIAGWIDGVYRDAEGVYHLVDLKTTSSMSRWNQQGDGKRHQATMYAVALQLSDILPEPINYLPDMTYTIVKPRGGGECARRVSVYPDLSDVAILGQKVRDAEATVSEGLFPRNPAWTLCSEKWCPHYDGCMVTGRLAGHPESVRVNLTVPATSLPVALCNTDKLTNKEETL